MKQIIAGVDEVGRGSLIGPVYAAAVILNKNIKKNIIKDSKKLSKKKREILFRYIIKNSNWSLAYASLKEIEKLNIFNASMLAMKRAIKKLKKKPKLVIVDGHKSPSLKNYKIKSLIKGDDKIPEIAAASIIAKVSRDRLIKRMSKKFLGYSWEKNAGYGTKKHLNALKRLGVTKYHRKSFRPVHNILISK